MSQTSPERDSKEQSRRKRTVSEANEAEGSPEPKRVELERDPLEDFLDLGNYPYNIKRTCVLHDHSQDKADPEGVNCSAFENEFGQYDSDVFIDQNEAEDLLATLENLAGKLASDTQPLQLEYNPANPPPLPLEYEYPPMLGWANSDVKAADKSEEKQLFNIENEKHADDRSI